ncbi:hypothetical protein, partial [Bacillus mycoides]|uniref:hypothetical protein n=1 Tax=Bacillus mycoides TaxID=1405 RepID=UPI001E585B18
IPIYTWLRVPDHIYHSSWDLYTKGPLGCFPSGFSYEKDNAFFSLWIVKKRFKHHKSFFTAYVIAFVFNKTDFLF